MTQRYNEYSQYGLIERECRIDHFQSSEQSKWKEQLPDGDPQWPRSRGAGWSSQQRPPTFDLAAPSSLCADQLRTAFVPL